MLRFLKWIFWLMIPGVMAPSALGFALLGPIGNGGPTADDWQVGPIGYGALYSGDIGAPKNIGEEYRRNMPVLYYSFDQNFLEYFGSNGVAAVDQAFAIMNSLTNVSAYSLDLSEFPLEAQRLNYEARELYLLDLKSHTLSALVEQMGLAQPERFVWTLHNRYATPGGPPCPAGLEYLVVKRNFGIVPSPLNEFLNSSYVNGTLYSYYIWERCSPPRDPVARTLPFNVDPLADTYTAVASRAWMYGGFYTYLTRDDVAGLRYLLETNNYNLESTGPGTSEFVTNIGTMLVLTNQDLGLLAAQASSTDAAGLQTNFPGLIVSTITNYLVLVTNVTVSVVITNGPPQSPAGTVFLMLVTNYSSDIVTRYVHTFGNIITNQFSTNTVVTIQTTSATRPPTAPVNGPLATNITSSTFLTNMVAGDFYTIPPGLCDIAILNSNLLTLVTATTNVVVSSSTNVTGTTNVTGLFFERSIITYFTNHVMIYRPVACPGNTTARRQGIERITFVRRDFDSLVGQPQTFPPATNDYTMVALANNTLSSQRIRRVVTSPDFLFTAYDDSPGPGEEMWSDFFDRSINFNQGNILPGLAGPGTIEPATTFWLNKAGPAYYNRSAWTNTIAAFIPDESTHYPYPAIWGSFDGTTNEPVVYPNSESISNLINQLVIRVYPSTLPDATNNAAYAFVYTNSTTGVVYTNRFSVTGGQADYAWSLAPNSPGLPTGLSLSSDGQLSGTPTGVTRLTTYDFAIRVTDKGARFVDAPFALTIHP